MTSMLAAGTILPAVLTAVVLFLIRRDWGWPIALAAGFGAAQLGLTGWPDFPPTDVTQWLPYLAFAAMLAGVFQVGLSDHSIIHWVVRFILVAASLWFLLSPMVLHRWPALDSALWLGGLALLWLALWAHLSVLSDRLPTPSAIVTLLPAVVASSFVLVFSYSAFLGQMAGALAASLTAGLLVILAVAIGESFGPGVPVTVILLGGLWVSGLFYAEVPREAAALLWVSPLGGWVAMLGALRSRPVWQRTVAAALVVAAIASVAVYWVYPTDDLGY